MLDSVGIHTEWLNDFSSVEPNLVGIKHSHVTGALFSLVNHICAGVDIYSSFVFVAKCNEVNN